MYVAKDGDLGPPDPPASIPRFWDDRHMLPVYEALGLELWSREC